MAAPVAALFDLHCQNIDAADRVAALPYTLQFASVDMLQHTILNMANEIELGAHTAEDVEKQRALVEQAAARTEAQRAEQRDAALPQLRRRAAAQLEALARSAAPLAAAMVDTNRQSYVMLWTANEILAQDLTRTLLNTSQLARGRVVGDDTVRKYFDLKTFDVRTLAEYDFNVSGHLGTILLERRAVDTVRAMLILFQSLFPTATDLLELLRDRRLTTMNLRRNLIVHRRAVADLEYIQRSGDDLRPGAELLVSPEDLESALRLSTDFATLLALAVVEHYPSSDRPSHTA